MSEGAKVPTVTPGKPGELAQNSPEPEKVQTPSLNGQQWLCSQWLMEGFRGSYVWALGLNLYSPVLTAC